MSNTVDSNKSVDVMHADCLQQTFSTGIGIGLHFPQTYQGKLSSGGSLGVSLCRAERAISIPPRELNTLRIIVWHCVKFTVDTFL